MEYLIRTIEEKDLASLVKLCKKHAQFEEATYDPAGKQALLRKAIFSERPKLFCFVIESQHRLLGYATYTFDFSTWDACTFLYLDCLYLEPSARSLGIGEMMIEKLKAVAIQNGCVNMQWQTPVFNERAIKFYNRMGGAAKHKVRYVLNLP